MKRKKKSQSSVDIPFQPELQLETFKALLSEKEYLDLQQEIIKTLLPALRLNPLKTSPDLPQRLAECYGWKITPIPFCSSGFRIETGTDESISQTIEHKTGMYYIQEAASMLPVELFGKVDTEDMLTLDLAASPGGKTTHLISRQKDSGLVIANDSSQSRIQALRIVLRQWGSIGSAVTRFPGEKYGSWFPNTFDRVLIDAPCSMQGLRTAESHASRPVTEKESKLLSQRQIALLTSALQAARPGGEVVYSTCTLLPAEDEGVVDAILKRFGNSVELLDANQHLPYPAPGLDQNYSAEMTKVVRLWPHRYQTAGFFACIFRKTNELDLSTSNPPEHSMEAAGFIELSSSKEKAFCESFESAFGFPLQQYMDDHKLALINRVSRFFIFPKMLLDRFRALPVQSAGLLLAEEEPDGLVPSQEWILRFGNQCKRITAQLSKTQSSEFLSGMDLAEYNDSITGGSPIRVIVDEFGRVLGRGKKMQGKLKNLSIKHLA